MNYYDYRSYFNEITGDLDRIYSRQGELLTELQEYRTETSEKLDTLIETVQSCSILITAVLLISVVFGVLTRW